MMARQVMRRSGEARDSVDSSAATIRQMPPEPIVTSRLALTRL